MPEVHRKQLHKAPETNDNYMSAWPQWFKFVVDYTDIQNASNSKLITLAQLPAKSWIHAVHWKVTTSFSQNGTWNPALGDASVRVSLGDEDDDDRWLNTDPILVYDPPEETSFDIEDGIGLIPWCPDFSNTHDLEALFELFNPVTGDLTDLDAGEMTFWFLLSSSNLS